MIFVLGRHFVEASSRIVFPLSDQTIVSNAWSTGGHQLEVEKKRVDQTGRWGKRWGGKRWWRRERDSNPRCRYKRHTRFPVVLLQPARTSLRIKQTTFSHASGSSAPVCGGRRKRPRRNLKKPALAERVGFEPTVPPTISSIINMLYYAVDPPCNRSVRLLKNGALYE
jgi:hypothetical protein